MKARMSFSNGGSIVSFFVYFDEKLSEEFVISFSNYFLAIFGDLRKYCLQFPKFFHFLICCI